MSTMYFPVALLILSLSAALGQSGCYDEFTGLDKIKNGRKLYQDDGKGTFTMGRVERPKAGPTRNGTLVPVTSPSASHPFGRFAVYDGDSYVIPYTTPAEKRGKRTVPGLPLIMYYWQGTSSSTYEKGASAIQTVFASDAVCCSPKHVRVESGLEPSHFLRIFDGTFVTLLGGKANEKVVQDNDGVMLFQVKSQCNSVDDREVLVRTRQVEPENRTTLNSADVFMLWNPNKVFIWKGRNSDAKELETAKKVARNVFKKTPVIINEGQETGEFNNSF